MEMILMFLILAATGDAIYLRVQEIELNMTIAELKNGTEVTRLDPLTYLGEALEPRNQAEYSIKFLPPYSYCNCLTVDKEGRVLVTATPSKDMSIVAVAKVHYQGMTNTTAIMINQIRYQNTDKCLTPTVNDCFPADFKFRVVRQNPNIQYQPEYEFLGFIGDPPDCFKATYKLNKGRSSKWFMLNNTRLYVSKDFTETKSKSQPKVTCTISPSNSKEKVSTNFTRVFPISVVTTVSLPHPISVMKTIIVRPDYFNQNGSLLLTWCWLPENYSVILFNSNLPRNSKITSESVPYNTINVKTGLNLVYLNWDKPINFFKDVFTINVIMKLSSSNIYSHTPQPEIKHVISLKIVKSMTSVNYSSDALHTSDHMSPFMSLAAPEDVKGLSESDVEFRSKIPSFIQSPYGVTKKGGIVYLQNWGPQLFPCGDTCPPLFIIEWTNDKNDNKAIIGTKIFRTINEIKKPGSGKCEEHGKTDFYWNSCGEQSEQKYCVKSCGVGATNGLCSWREAQYHLVTSTASPNGIVSTPHAPLTTEYATCRSNPMTCPDHWCDPLEELSLLICPQDCTDQVTGTATINNATRKGIFSASMKSTCTCGHSCSCEVLFPKIKTNSTNMSTKNEIELKLKTVQPSHSTLQTPHPTFGSLQNESAYCDTVCKAVISISTFIIVFLVFIMAFFRRKCVNKLKMDGGDDGTMSIDPLVPLQTLSTSPTAVTERIVDQIEIDTKWEIPRSRVEILETLGEGEFGKVQKARVKDLPSKQGLTVAAVKTLKENAGSLEFNDLMSEYSLLKEVNHPNIIKLLGACTMADGPIFVIIEYCSLGSLRNYLRKSRNAKAHECLEAGSSIEVTPKDILSFSWQICKGMAYLAEMKMVHRDLATRNILLAENKQCKISDFGMTRDVYVDDTYLKVSRSRVPVKWMALESLRENIYTSKSDVWSMGIVLWELVTLGSSPYPSIPAEKLYGLLISGYRMPRPPNCSVRLYEIMRECWVKEPFRRPNFAQLTNKFETMLGEDIEYLNCNIHAFSNPAYFNNGQSNSNMNNLDIRFSMSLDDLKSTNINGAFNLYENDICSNVVSYDVPKPISSNTYIQSKKIKDKIIDEKVDNR